MDFQGEITTIYGVSTTSSGKQHWDFEMRLPHGPRQKAKVWGDFETGILDPALSAFQVGDKITGSYKVTEGYSAWNAWGLSLAAGRPQPTAQAAPQGQRQAQAPTDKDAMILKQTAMKCASWLTAAEIQKGRFEPKDNTDLSDFVMDLTARLVDDFNISRSPLDGPEAQEAPAGEGPPQTGWDEGPPGDEPPFDPDDDLPF